MLREHRWAAAALAALIIVLFTFQAFGAAALNKGSRGSEVRRLQERLTELGYEPGTADGVYGNATYLAVLLFQSRNGLEMDGAAGAKTLEKLYQDTAVPRLPGEDESRPYVTEDGFPLLVNLEHPFAEEYVYYDLVVMNTYCDKSVVKMKYSNTLAEREAVDALMTMLRAAKAQGIGKWQISAANRTVSDQQRLMNNRINTNMKNGMSRKRAESAARQTVAVPGFSEHHLGTCFDITVPGVAFAGTKQHKWLLENCWDYGFILRYPEDKTEITGFVAEAWHFRYVGVEHARIMRDEDLCLEEYIEKYAQKTLTQTGVILR